MSTKEEIQGMKVAELRAALSARGLDAKGRKAQLQARLLETLQPSEPEPEPAKEPEPEPAKEPEPEPAKEPEPEPAKEPEPEPAKEPEPEPAKKPEPEPTQEAKPEPEAEPAKEPGAAAASLTLEASKGAEDPAAASQPEEAPPVTSSTSSAPEAAKERDEAGGDRSKDRSDRDRDRSDRDRDRSDRSRDRDRDRSDRDRDRSDRDRDRSDRDRDRDRGRDREREGRRSRDERESTSSRKRERSPEAASSRKDLRKRQWESKFWDVAPQGYEHLTPMQYKEMLTAGNLPPPGAAVPGEGGNMAAGESQTFNATHNPLTRQARRLYVGGIPFGITEMEMAEFFNNQLMSANLNTAPGAPIMSAQINSEKNFAFLEFRSVEETTNCVALDGVVLNGQALKLRRPKDYQAPMGMVAAPQPNPHVPGVVSTVVPDSPNKLYIGNVPAYLNEDQLKDLLSSFGELKALHLVTDANSASKGFAFCEYVDSALTDAVIQGLNGFAIGEQALTVQRSNAARAAAGPGVMLGGPMMPGMPGMPGMPPGVMPGMGGPLMMAPVIPGSTRVLVLLNMVTADELKDDEEYADIMEDIRDECSKFGAIANLKIPRPGPGARGVGKIFLEYKTLQETLTAQRALSGRRFGGKSVVTSFYSEDKFAADDLE